MREIRTLYLVRHGHPEFPNGIRRCIGRTEYPLSETGRRQARDLFDYFSKHPVESVYTSPLGRCRETAQILSGNRYPVIVEADLTELDMGEWEDVPMKELHKELESEPKQGEGRINGLKRFRIAVEKLMKRTKGDIAIVAHAGINCCYLSFIQNSPLEISRGLPQPYGGISLISIDEQGKTQIERLGVMPNKIPSEQECLEIWNRYQTPEHVRSHSRKVSEQAVKIGKMLNNKGCGLDLELIERAALLHDVVRTRPDHAVEGARILCNMGYPLTAEVIRSHHDMGIWKGTENECPSEREVVYLADKQVYGDQVVSLEERFASSKEKCLRSNDIEAALQKHELRYKEAKCIERKIKNYILRNGGKNEAN